MPFWERKMKMNSLILAVMLAFVPVAYASEIQEDAAVKVEETTPEVQSGEVKLSDTLIKENMDSLYKYNDAAYGYMLEKNETEEYVYVLSREDIPCFINFKSMLMTHGSSKNVKAIPVMYKMGFDESKIAKNNILLYFYAQAMGENTVGMPFIIYKDKTGEIQYYFGCPEQEEWDKIFY